MREIRQSGSVRGYGEIRIPTATQTIRWKSARPPKPGRANQWQQQAAPSSRRFPPCSDRMGYNMITEAIRSDWTGGS